MIPKIIIHKEIVKREQFAQDFIGKLGFSKNHPDLMWLGPEEKLGIETARKIKDFLNLKPYLAKGQIVIIISAHNLTPDAQNALLKTFEEHQAEVNLILGTESEEQLLPTLLSRCQTINLQICSTSGVEQKYREEIKKLETATLEQRFLFIEKLEDKDNFLFALTEYFRKKILNKKDDNIKFLKDLLTAERWAKTNVNIRAILEYLMLKMP